MPKKRKQSCKQRSPGDLHRAAKRREQHASLVNGRQGDPKFVQQAWNPDGSRTIQLNDETTATMREQRQAFLAKFGCEPGPDDPIFFDPTADEPRPPGEEAFDDAILKAFDQAGIDPAYAKAWRDLGYLVPEMNRHTFTAHEIEAWDEAVERYVDE